MTGSKSDLIKYRLERAKETFEDAKILRDKHRWNSAVNRLYYSAFYAVSALLLKSDLNPVTHNGVKNNFSKNFIKTNLIDKKYGKIYSQLFTWRHKGDYADLFNFDKEKVDPYFSPVLELIDIISDFINN